MGDGAHNTYLQTLDEAVKQLQEVATHIPLSAEKGSNPTAPEENRLNLASLYLEGTARDWFQLMHENHQLIGWDHFTKALVVHFGTKSMEAPKGILGKLQMTSTVQDYFSQFEQIAYRTSDPQNQFASFICFLFVACNLLPGVGRVPFRKLTLTEIQRKHEPPNESTPASPTFPSPPQDPNFLSPPTKPSLHTISNMDLSANLPQSLLFISLVICVCVSNNLTTFPFVSHTTLPPSRLQDHRIPLITGSTPVNVRPYCYPHFQKSEIEQLVSDMLKFGVIRPSFSPYSSPVMLVRQKDDTWCFCVDYRALSFITMKDRFPIPTQWRNFLMSSTMLFSFLNSICWMGTIKFDFIPMTLRKLHFAPMMATLSSFLFSLVRLSMTIYIMFLSFCARILQ
uniref:Retrotransposon gag domain-containing protein n=1 Tax=Solanum lycopersicum TaxID=4081 RepID=A0A3Q7IID1_SOLLC